MPTLLREKGYRFFFFSLEGNEPPHVHVAKAEGYAKFWLDPVGLARSTSFRGGQLREVLEIVRKHREDFLERWNEHFSDTL